MTAPPPLLTPLPTPPPMPLPPPMRRAEPGPLAYALQAHPHGARRVFDWRMFAWSAAFLVAWLMFMLLVVPTAAEMFMDFKVRVPFAARVVLAIGRALRVGLWVLVVPIPVAIGFLAAPMGPGGRQLLRIILTLAFAGLILFSVLSFLLPMLTLLNGMTARR